MTLLAKIKNIVCWSKSTDAEDYSDLSILDSLNSKLEKTVLDTCNISQSIIKKLEAKVLHIESELSEREQLLSYVFAGVSGILILKDAEGKWKLLNGYGKKIFNIIGNEYKDKTNEEMCILSPKYNLMYQTACQSDLETWAKGRPLQFEETCVDSNGDEIVFNVLKTPVFKEDGSRKHLLVHAKNITEELANTKHIRMLVKALNRASDSITVTDHNHIIIYANEAFCDIYGYALNEVLNKPRNIVASGLTPEDTYISMFKSIAAAIPWSGEMINKTKAGKILVESVSITPVLNGKPYPIYYIAVNRAPLKEETE